MTALMALLAWLRVQLPGWARPGVDDLEEIVENLRGLSPGSAAAVIACALLIYATKAAVLAAIALYLAAHWLAVKLTDRTDCADERVT